MRQSIRRIGNSILELLIPSATVQAATCSSPICHQMGKLYRCCRYCTNTGLYCTAWAPGICNPVLCQGI